MHAEVREKNDQCDPVADASAVRGHADLLCVGGTRDRFGDRGCQVFEDQVDKGGAGCRDLQDWHGKFSKLFYT